MIILLSRLSTSFVRNICWVNNGSTRIACRGSTEWETKNQQFGALWKMVEKVASYNSLLCLQMWTAQLSAAVMRRRETEILNELGKGWHKIEAANTQSHYPDTGSYGNGTVNLIHYLGRWNVHTSLDLALIILATEFLAWQCIAELSALGCVANQDWHSWTTKQVDCFNHRVVTMVADKLKRQWLWEIHFWY